MLRAIEAINCNNRASTALPPAADRDLDYQEGETVLVTLKNSDKQDEGLAFEN